MMLPANIKMALASLRSNKWRSFLTMLGVIIGVLSVITTVSLGEGVKQQIVDQSNHLGKDLITVRPGKLLDRDQSGGTLGLNLLPTYGSNALNESDLKALQTAKGVQVAVPISQVPGVPRTSTREFQGSTIIATTPELTRLINQKVEYGAFFAAEDKDKVVIGKRVAEQLFQENVPIGKTMTIREKTFTVLGVFEEFKTSPFSLNGDYNRAVFMPYDEAKKLVGGQLFITEVLARPNNPAEADQVAAAMHESLLKNHAGQEDFTVLKQSENLLIAGNLITLITSMIAGIAAISLIVGGIGIMNIMLVSVSERTHEIGVRKAVGANSQQILGQFLIEALVLSFVGGILGIVISIIVNYIIRILTTLTPVITLQVIGLSVGVSLVVGIIFGITPALKAARKDPIEALRE